MAFTGALAQIFVVFTLVQGLNAECSVTRRGVSSADEDTILRAHNTLRQKVANGQQSGQPAASNMNQLTWDSNLAAAAQKLADQCKFEHDHPKVAGFTYAGQNLAIAWSSSSNNDPSWNSPVQDWYNEVSKFNRNNISPFKFTSDTGHYTQVVWAATKKVGCGYSFYQDGNWNTKLYVCNYGEGGNYDRAAMYLEGQACSECECSTDYSGLCIA